MTEINEERISLDQQRMRFVYELLLGSKVDQNSLKQTLKGLPVSLRTNGLAVVTARLATEKNLYVGENLLVNWLLEKCPLFTGMVPENRKHNRNELQLLMQWCMEMSRLEYEAVQQESMRLLEQAKLVAEALWPEE
jgi:hypothetical protein